MNEKEMIKQANNMILSGTLAIKQSVDPVVPLLDMAADSDPDYKPVAECF